MKFDSISSIKLWLFFCGVVYSYFLPGVVPRVYDAAEEISLKTLKMTSPHTQMPFDYYYLGFCQPENIKRVSESLGELLTGDIIHNTPYKISKNSQSKCKVLCSKTLDESKINSFIYMIENKYSIQWILDNLAAIHLKKKFFLKRDSDGTTKSYIQYKKGFPIGEVDQFDEIKRYEIYNHVDITVRYHSKKTKNSDKFTVVGFEVFPRSINSQNCDKSKGKLFVKKGEKLHLTFTYSVTFEESKMEWSARWEPYMRINDASIHWFSFVNSVIPVITLFIVIAFILMRALKKDCFRYDALSQDPEGQLEERGWKLVHGDVFRPPRNSTLFCVLIGTGFQILAMSILLIFLLLTNVVTPTRRGSIPNAFLFLFVLMTYFSGLCSSMVNKMFGRENYKLIAFYSSLLYPGLNFGIFIILELLLWSQGSSGAVSFFVLFKLFFLWVGISVPLSVYGAYKGNMAPKIKVATKVNLIPRQIPETKDKLSHRLRLICAGLVPFFAAFIEIYILMNSIWLDRFYFMVGGFILIFFILSAVSCEMTIILCYLQLCQENYNWWWNAFFSAGSSGLCLFCYGIYYGIFNLHINHFVPFLLYLGYMSLLSLTLFLLMGTIGVVATFFFVNKIYSSIKID